ncbi:single-stranded-DNA-specific exonuclease RecJ [Aliifodinibius sp. S!AR15-10]|uniref:single-stranded-DNA-specific exonuclease RecJ n=1 Tax=Aliifodinibius sp. S!AR15-10 TaxID=2950437 RepID=UPI00285DB9EE|nr:single-stranded-DNA-specific exonuclease RecJ [Aliifodinibius sp. S!AR15-10]MDR8394379.1 single-stranded-DNA-specific exonuclease RecJ [Aliifodinibius sp. S!AR15-10]
MPFHWVYNEPENGETVSRLQQELGIPEKIAYLLSLRGIDSFDKAKKFFRADLDLLHDPFLMKDMQEASQRLARAIRSGEKILVYGDYDVDGTTATSILYIFLKDFGVDVEYFIPHRFKDGYGISPDGIQYARQRGAKLIVSVDCGITAVEEARMAAEQGIDLIICDHHNVGDEIPVAVGVLDPKRPDCNYPFDGLSGAGVGFKLIQGTIKKLGLNDRIAYKFLDLVAISIASDIVPITDENRILMREGLRMLNEKPRVGIQALLDLVNIEVGSISTSSIVFSIGPRINAAGRMGDASKAVKLMISETESEAKARAHELEAINIERRNKDNQTMEEAVDMVSRNYNLEKTSSMVLHDPDWHLGVIGIVASRLVDTYYRPAIMLSTVDGLIKGSARSIKGFNIYNALKECEDLLEQYGGHEYAAGLTIKDENLEEFKSRLNKIASGNLDSGDFEPELEVDCELDLSDINMRFWKLLSQFKPFGPENMRPVFVSKGVQVEGVPTIVGSGHLKMKVSQNGSGVFDVIGFNMHEYLPMLRNTKPGALHIAYSLEENYWNGRRTLQIKLRDLHIVGN